MYKIRVVNTASNALAVQIIRYENRKRIVCKHIGSAHNDKELRNLKRIANDVIDDLSKQLYLFESCSDSTNILHLNQSSFLGVHYTFVYEALAFLIKQFGFDSFCNQLLIDLVIIRIVEPASKLRSIELLELLFGIKHRRQSFYKWAPQWFWLKTKVEQATLNFAIKTYKFNYDLLFYDVTTLYFESFTEDELRKNGFSKDNKAQQPQILVALLVSKEGFPVAYQIFEGNTFEGDTFLPIIKAFVNENKVSHFTVVADAAMLSDKNIEALKDEELFFIVGARLANLANEQILKIDQKMERQDAYTIRIKTNKGFLICSYSEKRYRKGKHEMQKQIEKAKKIITSPSKKKKVKYTKSKDEKLELNQTLIEKNTKLLGIKGYYTNLEESISSNQEIINRYHQLYKIEQAFRISKSDLKSRPIFHYKQQPIQLHILICFMALAITKHIELQSGKSIRKFITECRKISDARMLNKINNKEIKIRTKYTDEVLEIIRKLKLPH